MPLYKSDHIEYNIVSGHIKIVMDGGESLPAYWAHPSAGSRFPGVTLLHNWWGITDIVRRMAHLFAQTGYYTIIPDLFNGATPTNHKEAQKCVKQLGEQGYEYADAALSVLEGHHQCNGNVAAVGMGMGGSLAFEAAIKRPDLEAAVAFYGFPQRYLGQFKESNTPILAIFGTEDPIIKPVVVNRLQREFESTPLRDQHRVIRVQNASHDFIADNPKPGQREQAREAWQANLEFIEPLLTGPPQKPHKVH